MVLFSLYREHVLEVSSLVFGPDPIQCTPMHLEEQITSTSAQDLWNKPAKSASGDKSWRRRTVYAIFGKRVLDISLVVLMLPIIAILLIIMLPIVIRDNGPFIYRHPRVGRTGKMFDCLKVRTMRTDSAEQLAKLLQSDPEAAREWAETQKLRKDPRITRAGQIFRKTSLDELPQLWNVLRGEMSLIGPRPVTLEEIERYGDARKDYISVRPGITGLWQIASSRYEMTYDERVAVDASYAKSVSFIGDMRILWGTVIWAMKPNGI